MLLLSPFKYWLIRHPVKVWWDWALPIGGGLALTGLVMFWPAVPSPYLPGGLIAGLQSLYAILGGFFVAALTLLATAKSDALDQPLSGWPATTYGDEVAPLTRHRFLCMLFGYLSFSAFALYCIGFGAIMLAPGLRMMFIPEVRRLMSAVFLLGYTFWLCHTFVTTLVGLYYFTDRLQRRVSEFIEMPAE